jgi:uncharacterized protein VirK/YbjX
LEKNDKRFKPRPTKGKNIYFMLRFAIKNKLKETVEALAAKDKLINELKNNVEVLKVKFESVNDEKERYLEELLMVNSDKESIISSINQLQEKLSKKEAENFQSRLEIDRLKKENAELMELLEEATAK